MITNQHKQDYEKNGVTCIRNVLTAAEIADISQCFEELCAEFDRPDFFGVESFGTAARALRYDGGIFFDFLCRDIPDFKNIVSNSKIPGILRDLLGLEKISLWRDEIHCKATAGKRTDAPWHQDVANLPFSGTEFVGVWIPLQDVTEDNSPLCTITGSHRDRSFIYRPWEAKDKGELAPGYVKSPDFDSLISQGAVEWERWLLNAGDALILHPYVVHGAPRNASTRRRVSYVTRWLGDDVRWSEDQYSIVDPEASRIFDGDRPNRTELPTFYGSHI